MIQVLYLGQVGYGEGLRLQADIGALVAEGRLSNVLLLLEHPPVLTLGRHANRANVLASDELLAARGIELHQVNRGGDVTYHGPGQLVGYPLFDLRTLQTPSGGRMGPVDFVRGMEDVLIRVCTKYGVMAGRVAGLTGVWCGVIEGQDANEKSGESHADAKKIGAIGIHVAKGITSHGFAFNVTTNLRDFDLIIPCGIADHGVTSLAEQMPQAPPSLESIAHEAARQFGQVFDRQVLTVESVDALLANASPRSFPAEDTPLQIPEAIERLIGCQQPVARA